MHDTPGAAGGGFDGRNGPGRARTVANRAGTALTGAVRTGHICPHRRSANSICQCEDSLSGYWPVVFTPEGVMEQSESGLMLACVPLPQ